MKHVSLDFSAEKKTEISIGKGFLFSGFAAGQLKRLGKRFALFCDSNVRAAIGEKWADYLKKEGIDVSIFSFPPGEKEKSRERKAELEDCLIERKWGREGCFLALGGGVTSDLVGFLAATYHRGVPLVLIPTTLLAMVDACIGGKTGVNTPYGKNLIGAFYPANQVWIDTEWMANKLEGMAEVIKYGLIHSKELLEILDGDLIPLIERSIAIKAEIVRADPEEKLGLRRILNFGHTIGHAIEQASDYAISHGNAVAIGLLAESYLSKEMGLLGKESFAEVERIIRQFSFPLKAPRELVFSVDKKGVCGTARFVLLKSLGECVPFDGDYCTQVPDAALKNTLEYVYGLH
ncbi:MAG: 3-dehydroquinate synthase [Verrucomicrobia bacterium]|nr:3-dehydroquinate synthase [Verrucomicrobiota bacterium]